MFTKNTQRNGGSVAGTSNPNNCSAVAGMLIGVCLMFTTPLVADTIYVDDDAPAAGDGASWNTAFRFLQDGIAASQQGDTIRIAQGVYQPDRSEAVPDGTGDRETSFHIVSDTIIEGGYAGLGAPDPDVRDPEQFETILSGDLNGDDEEGFINYGDNSYTIVNLSNTSINTVVAGVTITAGSADVEQGEDPTTSSLGGAIFADNGLACVTGCNFHNNQAQHGGAIYWRYSALAKIENSSFTKNRAWSGGGAIRTFNVKFVAISDVSAADNSAAGGAAIAAKLCGTISIAHLVADSNHAEGGGAVGVTESDVLELRDSSLVDNTSFAGTAGLLVSFVKSANVVDCNINSNSSQIVAGGCLVVQSALNLVNCQITNNSAGWFGGGIVTGQGDIHFVNCLIAQNDSPQGGGVDVTATNNPPTFTNCTIAHNSGSGVNQHELSGIVELKNCNIWGNFPEQLSFDESPPPVNGGTYHVTNSNVQGGWPGLGNKDADPLFVQPGTLNYGLAYGSPCLNAANNAILPPDSFDLDGDGDLTEPLPIDLVGNPRIIDEIVDMGALEGASEMLPPAAGDFDFDPGEFTFLIPSLQEFNPLQHTAAFVVNSSDSDNETVIFTDLGNASNGESGSGSTIHLLLETSLNDGEISAYLYAPITAADLDPEDPLAADLVIIDPASGDRLLATAFNIEHNPHTGEPIGRRFVSTDSDDWQNTFTVGDYGIVWDANTQRGFVWANVDVAGEFQLRQSTCPGDCFPSGGNEAVNIGDLLELLGFWSYEHRWCDFNDDGIVDAADLTILLEHWGICSP